MTNDLMALAILNYEVEHINEDIISSFETMLSSDTFSKYYEIINTKLNEYKILKEKRNITPIFKTNINKFYKTKNDSIVFVSESSEDATYKTIFKNVVIKGGFDILKLHKVKSEKQLAKLLKDYQYDGYNTILGSISGTSYVTDPNGQYIFQENNKDFCMHLKCEIKVDFKELGISKEQFSTPSPTLKSK